MNLRFSPRSGPLGRVATRLAQAAPTPGAPLSPADPATQLARLVDLAGSVKLSRVLGEGRPTSVGSEVQRPELIAAARRAIAGDFEELEAHARACFARVARRRDDPRALDARLVEEAARLVVDAHRRANDIRRSVGVDLASASSECANLERLTATIDEATDAQVEARLARLIPATAAAHPAASSGDAAALARALEAAVLAVVAFERRRIDALADACDKLVSARAAEAISA